MTQAVQREGKASCGTYLSEIANELLQSARQRIDESGCPLRVTSRRTIADEQSLAARCKLCGEALDDMLFAGGRLNVKLLGGARVMEK